MEMQGTHVGCLAVSRVSRVHCMTDWQPGEYGKLGPSAQNAMKQSIKALKEACRADRRTECMTMVALRAMRSIEL